jgi:hypothetical protein
MRLGSMDFPARADHVFREIDGSRDKTQVVNIAASLVPTTMVNNKTFWDRSVSKLPHIAMNANGPAVQEDAPIAFSLATLKNVAWSVQANYRTDSFLNPDTWQLAVRSPWPDWEKPSTSTQLLVM